MNYLPVQQNRIKKVNVFKYLGEWVNINGNENISLEKRAVKMGNAFKNTRSIYNKKALSWGTRIKHFETVIKPEALYGAETLKIKLKGSINKIIAIERKIVRNILGPRKNETQYNRPRTNKEIYSKVENIIHTMRKRRLMFFRHIARIYF